VVLWYKGEIVTESDAILLCLKEIGGVWRWAHWLRIIPRFLRNLVYRLVAKYRYVIFGKNTTCRMPLPDERLQFLD
jgi:predicted DCC family thiol-disulfide oxidoreductase YuxK